MEALEYFTVINFDGWNVGFRDVWNATWLEFDSAEEACDVIDHWVEWMNGK